MPVFSQKFQPYPPSALVHALGATKPPHRSFQPDPFVNTRDSLQPHLPRLALNKPEAHKHKFRFPPLDSHFPMCFSLFSRRRRQSCFDDVISPKTVDHRAGGHRIHGHHGRSYQAPFPDHSCSNRHYITPNFRVPTPVCSAPIYGAPTFTTPIYDSPRVSSSSYRRGQAIVVEAPSSRRRRRCF